MHFQQVLYSASHSVSHYFGVVVNLRKLQRQCLHLPKIHVVKRGWSLWSLNKKAVGLNMLCNVQTNGAWGCSRGWAFSCTLWASQTGSCRKKWGIAAVLQLILYLWNHERRNARTCWHQAFAFFIVLGFFFNLSGAYYVRIKARMVLYVQTLHGQWCYSAVLAKHLGTMTALTFLFVLDTSGLYCLLT